MAEKKDELLEHNYDGIQEYDNDLPRWWLALFVVTFLYGMFYLAYYQFGPGLLQYEQLAKDMGELEAKKQQIAQQESAAEANEKVDLKVLLAKSDLIANGQKIFTEKCFSCHGMNAEGLVGPNLTDKHWIHGAELEQIEKVIAKGVAEKGMLAWEGMLSKDDIHAVTGYIWSLRGTNPANAKAAEGTLYDNYY